VWTWVAFDPDSKLVASWLVGRRDAVDAVDFMTDLADRLRYRIQLTTDGHSPYVQAVEVAFGKDVDYAMLVKEYGYDPDEPRRFGPPVVLAETVKVVTGNPDPTRISTSYVERQNLTMRMGTRRFTRLTNGFSKKVENHSASIALHFMYMNFARPHKSLANPCPRTPAMAAGLADHIWTCEDIAALLD
jgi:IS1 family transposase